MDEQKKTNGIKDKIMLVVDICFVMVLCVVVLFITMFIQNSGLAIDASTENGYVILPQTLIPVIVAIVGYISFLVIKGKKSLKEIVDIAYEGKEGQDK